MKTAMFCYQRVTALPHLNTPAHTGNLYLNYLKSGVCFHSTINAAAGNSQYTTPANTNVLVSSWDLFLC